MNIEYLLSGGYYRNNNNRSIKLVVVAWCFAVFALVNIYSSCLTSYMSLIFQRPDIRSLKDLATNPKYDLAIVKGSAVEEMFMVFHHN